MWCSSTHVCRYQHPQQSRSQASLMAAVDAALAQSITSQIDADTCPTDTARMSKLHGLLKRRLHLCTTESRIKTAVEDLIKKYSPEACTVTENGVCNTVTKYCCYSATCVTQNASCLSSPCYSTLCRHTQEQAYSCKVDLPDELQDLCKSSYTLPNTDNEFSDSQNTATDRNGGLDSKSDSTVNSVSKKEVDEKQSAVEDRTALHDSTKELRSLTGLLQRHVSNGQVHLTEGLVNRLRSLLDTASDTRHPVCLCGTIRKSVRRKTEIPVAADFRTGTRHQSVFVLMPSILRHLARSGGMLFTVPGFSSAASTKTDAGWIYIGPRPLFCTAWRYRTASARNLSAIALQLRILWCCIRWDDMSVDSSDVDDIPLASETDSVTKTTILRQRDVGQDGLCSEYLVRRVSVPAAADYDWNGNQNVIVILRLVCI